MHDPKPESDEERDAGSHRPSGPADEGAEDGPEHEGEQGVNNVDEPGAGEGTRVDIRRVLHGGAPPRQERIQCTDDRSDEEASQEQLDYEPADATDALRPSETIR